MMNTAVMDQDLTEVEELLREERWKRKLERSNILSFVNKRYSLVTKRQSGKRFNRELCYPQISNGLHFNEK